MKEKFKVTGMTCSACSSRVEKTVCKLEGTDDVSVNLLTGTMQVTYDEKILDKEQIVHAVEKAGYGAFPDEVGMSSENTKNSSGGDSASQTVMNEATEMRKRLIGSVLFLLPLMYVSMGHMLTGNHQPDNPLTMALLQIVFLIPIVALNKKYFIKGFPGLFRGSPNMDSLIAMGSTAAIVYGVFAVFRMVHGYETGDLQLVHHYGADLYFESAGTILTLITVGKYLETRSKGKTSQAIEKLMNLAPKTAVIERDGKEVTVETADLRPGDILIVRPGESLAADGEIISGRTSIDESAITGESIPVEKTAGDRAVSATINKTGFIRVRCDKTGEDSTINQIIRLVDEASASKAPIARMADKIAGIFVPVVIGIAVAATVIWLLAGAEFEFALSIGISVLVISCPCALGLATPVAIMVGTGKGAENGILIKSGEALEIVHSIDTVVMDKTGTITEGKPRVTDVKAFGVDQHGLLSIGAGLEKGSEHPLAEAVMAYAEENRIEPRATENFTAVFGRGVKGDIDGKTYFAGNEAMMTEMGISTEARQKELNDFADQGKTPLIFADGKIVIGIIAVADMEKETSKEAIEAFTQMKIDVVMLTGDNKRTAEALRKRMGIPKVIAEVLPSEKEKHIAALQAGGHKVAMIGDGINDAPALAKADVGIAIGAGTDVAIESADAVLMRNDLLDAVTAVKLSKAVIRNIKENLFWAFFYNTIGIPLAAGVLYPFFAIKLSPMFGAAAMSLSSVCVVLNALRLKRFKTRKSAVNVEEKGGKEMKYELMIKGMMCQHCQKHVEDALSGMEGVASAEVNLESAIASVTAEREISTDEFAKVIEEAGYTLVRP